MNCFAIGLRDARHRAEPKLLRAQISGQLRFDRILVMPHMPNIGISWPVAALVIQPGKRLLQNVVAEQTPTRPMRFDSSDVFEVFCGLLHAGILLGQP